MVFNIKSLEIFALRHAYVKTSRFEPEAGIGCGVSGRDLPDTETLGYIFCFPDPGME